MKGDMVEKIIMEADGDALEELVALEGYNVEYGTVNVPGRDKTTPVSDGVKNIPEVPGVFKTKRGSPTIKILKDWFTKKQFKNLTIIRVDGTGEEISRELWPNTELKTLGRPAYAAETPTYANRPVVFLPEDIIEL